MPASPGTPEYAANLALGHLGVPEIASLSDATTRARKARLAFNAVRDTLLRRKDWNFASTWVTPAQDPADSIGHFRKRFPMPPDCVAVRELKNCDGAAWDVERSVVTIAGAPVESVILVTNVADPVVRYTGRVDVRMWDQLFLDVFACALAAALAASLGKSQSTAEKWREKAETLLPAASKANSKEQSKSHQRPPTSWELARRRPLRYWR